LLTGETRLRKILRGGAATHGHIHLIDAIAFAQLSISLADGRGNVLRKLSLLEESTQTFPQLRQRCTAVLPIFQASADLRQEIVGFQEGPVCVRCRRKAIRDANAFVL
jgi:hypothetical protein